MITTQVIDNNKKTLDINTLSASTYAGYAYYREDGTFRIVDFKDQPKMFGLWKLTDNQTKRHLTVFKNDNTISYERSVDLLTLDNKLFTYRIAPNSTDASIFYDVEHKPVTNHPEPKTPAETLASVEWTTTKVLDITKGGEQAIEMDKTKAPAANFSGDVYYVNLNGNKYFPKNAQGEYVNGTFLITNYGDKNAVRSQGDWYVSVDGSQCVLMAKNSDNSIAWKRAVAIVELNNLKFTYDIVVGEQTLRVEHKPLKK